MHPIFLVRYSCMQNIQEIIYMMMAQIALSKLGETKVFRHPTAPLTLGIVADPINRPIIQAAIDYHFDKVIIEFLDLWRWYVNKNNLGISEQELKNLYFN